MRLAHADPRGDRRHRRRTPPGHRRRLSTMLTARDAPTDRVAALDEGADDYLVKPFDYAELLSRPHSRAYPACRRLTEPRAARRLTLARSCDSRDALRDDESRPHAAGVRHSRVAAPKGSDGQSTEPPSRSRHGPTNRRRSSKHHRRPPPGSVPRSPAPTLSASRPCAAPATESSLETSEERGGRGDSHASVRKVGLAAGPRRPRRLRRRGSRRGPRRAQPVVERRQQPPLQTDSVTCEANSLQSGGKPPPS